MPEQSVKKKSTCTSELMFQIIKWINCFFALLVICLGVYKYAIFGGQTTFSTFSAIFIPLYLIVFGLLLICAEQEWIFMVKYFKFLDNLFGRGLFNFYLATVVVNQIQSSLDSQNDAVRVFTLSLSAILSIIGLLYIIVYFAKCGEKSQKFQDHDLEVEKTLAQQQMDSKQLKQPMIQNQRDESILGSPNNMNYTQWQDLQSNKVEYQKWLQTQLNQLQNS